MAVSHSSTAPCNIPLPAVDAVAFLPPSKAGVMGRDAISAPTARRTATGLAFGDAPASAPAPSVTVAAPSPSDTTIRADQLPEKPEVTEALDAVELAEGRLHAARMVGGASDAELKKLQLEVASSKLALGEASDEPADVIENLRDKVVVAKVLLGATIANDKNAVVAFIRGGHLFMNNEAVDYVRKLFAL